MPPQGRLVDGRCLGYLVFCAEHRQHQLVFQVDACRHCLAKQGEVVGQFFIKRFRFGVLVALGSLGDFPIEAEMP